jgi:acetyl esterase
VHGIGIKITPMVIINMKIKIILFVFLISFLCSGNSIIKPDKLIMFKKIADTELYLHAFYPQKKIIKEKNPAIVFFFGGGWNTENKTQFYRQSKYLSSLGIACFCADYRVQSIHNVSPDQCVMDAKSAIRYIRENNTSLFIDSNRIIASGGSAGGHLAASTAILPLI